MVVGVCEAFALRVSAFGTVVHSQKTKPRLDHSCSDTKVAMNPYLEGRGT